MSPTDEAIISKFNKLLGKDIIITHEIGAPIKGKLVKFELSDFYYGVNAIVDDAEFSISYNTDIKIDTLKEFIDGIEEL